MRDEGLEAGTSMITKTLWGTWGAPIHHGWQRRQKPIQLTLSPRTPCYTGSYGVRDWDGKGKVVVATNLRWLQCHGWLASTHGDIRN